MFADLPFCGVLTELIQSLFIGYQDPKQTLFHVHLLVCMAFVLVPILPFHNKGLQYMSQQKK